MILWIKNITIAFVILSCIYFVVSTSMRLKERRRLSDQFRKENSDLSREEFIAQGMEKFKKSLRARLALLVFIVPMACFLLLMFLAQQ